VKHFQDLEPIEFRHAQIKDNQANRTLSNESHPCGSRASYGDGISARREHAAQ
jgi:hypothetical protein